MNTEEKIEYLKQSLRYDPVVNAAVLNVIRTLGKPYPHDGHYQGYRDVYDAFRADFFDLYHLLWHVGAVLNPQNIMEIGCRSGTSIIQLLSAMTYLDGKRVVLFDSFWGEKLGEGDSQPINESMVRANIAYMNIPIVIVEFVVGLSQETVPIYKRGNPDTKFDYILVDGAHDFASAKIDLENATKILAPEGLLLIDDIAVNRDLLILWNEFKAEHEDKFLFTQNFIWKGIGVAVKRKRRRSKRK